MSISTTKLLHFLLMPLLMVSTCASAFPAGNLISKETESLPAVKPGSQEIKLAPRPAWAASPSISIKSPGEVLIGEDFEFELTFRNTGGSPGFGPFVDLVLPANGADGNRNLDTQDGVTFLSASTYGYTFGATGNAMVKQIFPAPAGQVTCVKHPWVRLSNGEYAQVCGPSGDTLVSLRLPFGGFVPGQPAVNILVKAHLSNLADLDTALKIHTRGGFMFGNDSLDNWCCGDAPILSHPPTNSVSWPAGDIIPKVLLFQKTYAGPDNIQDETTSGPNFERQYTLSVNIATGQTLTNLGINDKLPVNEQYVSLASGTTGGYAVISEPGTTSPGGKLSLSHPSVVGTLAKEDVKIVFNFHIPRLDAASQAVINPASGDDVLSKNIAWVTADWQPADARDAAQAVSSDSKCVPGGICQPLHTLQDKSIAIQKTVTDLTDGNPSPGDVLEYTLSFQVSDYFAFNSVVVSDLISDGQHVQDSFTPVLQIDGNGYALPTAVISPVNYDVACNYTGGPGPECTLNNPSADDGATRLEFRVSNEIVTRGQNGRLIGGCVNPAGGLLPVCTSASRGAGATTGTITFRSVILENFANNYPSGDRSVDQGDLFSDLTNIHGLVLNNNTFAPGQPEDDDATAEISIGRKNLSKSIYAVNGLTNSSAWQTDSGGNVVIKPGDTLTYRLSYSLNTSDVENLALDDYLPLPVFFAGDPDANDNTAPKHDDGPVFVFDDVTGATPPAVGHAQFGPGDTFRAYSGIVPTIGRNLPANTLSFNYGDFDDPRDQSTVLDVLFTLTVSSEPFADSLFIMNDVHEKEGSTNNGDFAQDALVGVVLTQPALATTKGVIWTSSSAAVFNPVVRGPVSFYGPASAPRWTGLINSAGLAAHPIDSNIGGVRGGDIVSFAIAIENKGSSLEGAFDLVIRDAIPGIFQIPTGGLNLQIYYGNGSGPINTEVDGVVKTGDCGGGGFGDPCGPDGQANTPDDIFGNGIKLVDPVGSGVCQAYNPNLGNNVILLTYDLQVKPNLKPGTYTNTARISNYSGYEGGSGHVSSGDTVWNYLVADTAETAWITSGGIASAGFAPRRISHLPDQPANLQYQDMTGTWLEIPSLKLKLPVMAVPMTRAGWDLDWLSNQAGYLQGTTPPGALGNTALAAHVYLADGQPGPFIDLRQMSWGQSVILHHDGYRYLYEVRQNQRVLPSDLSVFDEDGYAWLTLLTCQDYSETSHTYLYRTAVRAVLLKVEKE